MPEQNIEDSPGKTAPMDSEGEQARPPEQRSQLERQQAHEQELRSNLPEYLKSMSAFEERFGEMMRDLAPEEKQVKFEDAVKKARSIAAAKRIGEIQKERMKR